jgi:hypothetical protein
MRYSALMSKLLKHNIFILFIICLLMVTMNFHFNKVIFGQTQKTLNQSNIVELTAEKVGKYVWKSNGPGFNPLLN